MSLSADVYLDRLRLKNKLTFWRVATILAMVAAALVLLKDFGGERALGQDYIARINIENVILDDQYRDDVLDDLANDKHLKGLIVRIDSPGGTMVGGQEIYLGLRKIAKHTPVVAQMRTLAASAAYMSAIGADYIIAREGTLTGSIGVLMEGAEFTKLAEKVGITPIIIKSAPLKASPGPMEPLTPEVRAATQAIILDSYNYFKELVAQRRKLNRDQLERVSDGRVFTGRQALALKLVDAMGGEAEAVSWMESDRKINKNLPIYDVDVKKPKKPWTDGFDSMMKNIVPELRLDGLTSIWHPNLL